MQSLRRIRNALIALLAVTMIGTGGYLVLGFTFLDALYQTVTTVATVGFREVQPLSPAGQVFTIVLISLGVGTVLYNLSVILEAVTEGHLREHLASGSRRSTSSGVPRSTGVRSLSSRCASGPAFCCSRSGAARGSGSKPTLPMT